MSEHVEPLGSGDVVTITDVAGDEFAALTDRELLESIARSLNAASAQVDWLCQQVGPLLVQGLAFVSDPAMVGKLLRSVMKPGG